MRWQFCLLIALSGLAGCMSASPEDTPDGASASDRPSTTLEWDTLMGAVVEGPAPFFAGPITIARFSTTTGGTVDGTLTWDEPIPARFRLFFIDNEIGGPTVNITVASGEPFSLNLTRANIRVEARPADEAATAGNRVHLLLTGALKDPRDDTDGYVPEQGRGWYLVNRDAGS